MDILKIVFSLAILVAAVMLPANVSEFLALFILFT